MQSMLLSDTTLQRETTLESVIEAAAAALLACQHADGHWVFELEADATIPAEYVLLTHYLGEAADRALEGKIAAYLRRIQNADGGWPLFHGGASDISATVKAYFALKVIGEAPDAPAMHCARQWVLAAGGAEKVNVFTRFTLALFGILSWRSVPTMPVEIVLLPRWFPFHLTKVSYWARTVLVPLLVLQALKPRARNTGRVTLDELFHQPPSKVGARKKASHQKWTWFAFFDGVDRVLHAAEPWLPAGSRRRAIDKAVAFVVERLNGEDGLGAIFPAMANAVMMFDALGYAPEQPQRATARAALDKLLIVKEDEAYCQPCLSPVWDTVLAGQALLEAGGEAAIAGAVRGLDWLLPLQVLDVRGDWVAQRPDVPPGGWAFQYANPHYPDLDDTAVVVMAMDRARRLGKGGRYTAAVARARAWVEGLQSRDGGWGAFDADNDHEFLNNIPFSDHGALLDPPSPDLTARCVSMLAQLGETQATSPALSRGLSYLRRTQRPDGAWYGRWGVNYIYGTWSALCALHAAGVAPEAPEMRKATAWLLSIQNADGGWGEDGDSYRLDYDGHRGAPSAPSQTAWALLGLMAGGVVDHSGVARGIAYLRRTQQPDGSWQEEPYTGTGFPRVFYLRYHGYPKIFSLWALARHRNLIAARGRSAGLGM
jgi:squalene-hopene/tetraprenyl-beta-curcumene cyclase